MKPSRPWVKRSQPKLLAHAKRELVIELWSIGPSLWFIDLETDDGQPVRDESNRPDRAYSSAAEALGSVRALVRNLKATSRKGQL